MSNDELIKELFDSVADLAGFVDVALSSDKCDVFGFLHNDATDALIKAEQLLKLLKD
jgi:hypothetical protein